MVNDFATMSFVRQIFLRIEANHPLHRGLELYKRVFECDDIDYTQLGEAVRKNTHLTKLNIGIRGASIPLEKFKAFCQGLIHNRSISHLQFGPCAQAFYADVDVLQLMGIFVRNNPNLVYLSFSGPYMFNCPEQFPFLCSILRAGSSVQRLVIAGCGMETIEKRMELMLLIGEMSNLKILEWSDRPEGYQVQGIPGFADLLQNELSKLKELRVLSRESDVNREVLPLIQSLENNTSLELLDLSFPSVVNPIFDSEPLVAMLRFNNHTLQRFKLNDSPEMISDEVESLLEMNRSTDKENIRIRKGLDYGFLLPDRVFDCRPLKNEFECTLLPYLLASIGTIRSERDHRSNIFRCAALYHFIRNKPLLVVESGMPNDGNASNSESVETDVLGKRKRSGSEN